MEQLIVTCGTTAVNSRVSLGKGMAMPEAEIWGLLRDADAALEREIAQDKMVIEVGITRDNVHKGFIHFDCHSCAEPNAVRVGEWVGECRACGTPFKLVATVQEESRALPAHVVTAQSDADEVEQKAPPPMPKPKRRTVAKPVPDVVVEPDDGPSEENINNRIGE